MFVYPGAMTNSEYEGYKPGTYVKGDATRVADTVADAVQAAFDGYTRLQTDADVAGPLAAVNANDPEAVRTDESGSSEAGVGDTSGLGEVPDPVEPESDTSTS
jgi:hypothetical protein